MTKNIKIINNYDLKTHFLRIANDINILFQNFKTKNKSFHLVFPQFYFRLINKNLIKL